MAWVDSFQGEPSWVYPILFMLFLGIFFLLSWVWSLRRSMRKRMAELGESETRYKDAQQVGHVGSWEYFPDTEIFWGSDEAARIYGFDSADNSFTTEAVEQCIPERQRVHKALVALIEKDQPYDLEFDVQPVDGSATRTISSVAKCVRDEQGNVLKVTGVITNITESKKATVALREREEQLRLKLDTLLSPDKDIETYELENIFDFPTLQSLLEDFSKLTGMVSAILDLKGNILLAVGWQDICTRFHRAHPETCQACTESDLYFAANIKPGEYVAYKCKNHLWDMAAPLMLGDKHVGNIYVGQFFYEDEEVDRQVFIDMAQRYGFDQDAYLAALDRVPRMSPEEANAAMEYLMRLTGFFSKLSFTNVKLAKAIGERKYAEELLVRQRDKLEELVAERVAELARLNAEQRLILDSVRATIWYKDTKNNFLRVNKAAAESVGLRIEDIEGKATRDLFPQEAEQYYKDDLEVITSGQSKLGIVERLRMASGQELWMLTDKIPIKDDAGLVTGIIAFAIDITESRTAQQDLEKRKNELRTIVNAMAGRENRMIALKKVIKTLCAQLERAGLVPEADESVQCGSDTDVMPEGDVGEHIS